jgi:hypothetical protein
MARIPSSNIEPTTGKRYQFSHRKTKKMGLRCCKVFMVNHAFVLWIGSNLLFGFAESFASGNAVNHYSGTNGVAPIPLASPECWLTAVKAFDFLKAVDSATNTVAVCQWMTSNDQKLLALELARCHLKDLDRPLVHETSKCSNKGSLENLTTCLHTLTDAGMTSYTHFFSYVNQLCTRLLQEVVVGHFYEASHRLAASSELAEERLSAMIQHHGELWDAWKEQDERLLDMHETFKDHVRDQSNLLTQHVSQLQREMRGQQEEWLVEHNHLQQEQTRKLQNQHEELERLSQIVARTNTSILPWSVGLDSLASQVLKGYSFLKVFLYLIGVLQVIWVFTYPQRLRWLGYYLKRLTALEAILECRFIWENDGLLSCREGQALVSGLRAVTFIIASLFYLLGMLTSLFRRQDSKETQVPEVVTPENIPNQAIQESILSRLESFETEWKMQQQRKIENVISNAPMRSNDNINTKGTVQATSSDPEVWQGDGAHMSRNPVYRHHSTSEHEHFNRLATNPNFATFPPAGSNVVTPPLDRTFRPPAWNPSYWNPHPTSPHDWDPMAMTHWVSNSNIFPQPRDQQTANMEDQQPSDSNSEHQDDMDQMKPSHGHGSSPSNLPSDVHMETHSRSIDREAIDTPPTESEGQDKQDDHETDTGSNESSLFFRKRAAVDMVEEGPLAKRFKKQCEQHIHG